MIGERKGRRWHIDISCVISAQETNITAVPISGPKREGVRWCNAVCFRKIYPGCVLRLTHTVTHVQKKVNGVNGWESIKDHSLLQQKCPKVLNSGTFGASNQLVRMRPAVQIRRADPENGLFLRKQAVFFAFCYFFG